MVEIDRTQIVGDFLRGAIADPNNPIGRTAKRQGIYLASHPDKHLKTLGINLLGIYYAFPKSTYVEIGQTYGITSERVRQVIEKSTRQIWESSSIDFKNKYPLRDLTDKGRAKKLRGNTEKALNLNLQGKNTLEIKKELDLKNSEMSRIKTTLEERGISMNKLTREEFKILEKINNSTDDTETQLLLNRIDRSGYGQIGKHYPNALINIKNLAQSLGFHPSCRHVHDFVTSLKSSGIPMGEIAIFSGNEKKGTYHFISSKDSDRASEILLNNPDLGKYKGNSTIRVCGPVSGNLPTIWDLRRKGEYVALRKILQPLGVWFSKSKSRFVREFLLTDKCPVQVFYYRNTYSIDIRDKAALAEFFKIRILELKGAQKEQLELIQT